MANTFKIGDLDVTVLSDGTARAPRPPWPERGTATDVKNSANARKRFIVHSPSISGIRMCLQLAS